MQHSFVALYVHITFAVERRQRLLDSTIRPRAHAYLATVARNLKVDVYAVGGVEDHVHLALAIRSDLQLSTLVRDLKSNSSRFIAETTGRPFAWQRGYAAFSVSPSAMDRVIHYIETQEEHHKRQSTIDELNALLKRYRVRRTG
jgi:putative transposase